MLCLSVITSVKPSSGEPSLRGYVRAVTVRRLGSPPRTSATLAACSPRPPTGRTSTPLRWALPAAGSPRPTTDSSDEWATVGLDFPRAERSAENARSAVARLIGADVSDIALIPSVSSAAGLVAAQLGQARPGDNVVIGQREYSSNHFPWRQLVDKGYDVRQVAFRNGGLEPEDVGERINLSTKLVAFSGVQSATGHRSDISAISYLARNVGAIVFVDGSQLVGALPVAHELPRVDVLVAPDHKFLLNAGRGMGYCYLSPAVQRQFTPINAGWKASAVPLDSFFGPEMTLSTTASRFDNSISWLAAMGNETALTIFDDFGPETIYARNHGSRAHSGLPWLTRGALSSTCRKGTGARSSRSLSATTIYRESSACCPSRESSLPLGMETSAYRSTSTTTRTTFVDWQGLSEQRCDRGRCWLTSS